ncbi:MAG: tetratricopeptide repeat protein [Candidatus Hodarchaeales archaeon]
MNDESKSSITDVEQLVEEGKFEEALQIVKGLERMNDLSVVVRLNCFLLESNIMIKLGHFGKAYQIARKSLLESQRLRKHLLEVDSYILMAEARWRMGKNDEGLDFIDKGKNVLSELPDKNSSPILKRNGALMFNEGVVRVRGGDLVEGLRCHHQSLKYREKIGNKFDTALSLNSLGVAYYYKGNLDRALDYYKRSLTLKEELGNKQEIAKTINNLGEVYRQKGELELSLDNYQRSLVIKEEIGNKQEIAIALNNLGIIYRQKGLLDKSREYLVQALALQGESDNTFHVAETLFELIGVFIDKKDKNLAREYLEKLHQVSEQSDNKIINQQYRVAKALLLKSSGRVRKKIEAERILEQIIHEEIVDHQYTVIATLHLCDLLLFELRTSGEEEILEDVNTLARRLLVIAKEQHSHSLLVEIYLLQAKLALLELDVDKAQKYLSQAHFTANEKGLRKLAITVSYERDLLLSQVNKWKNIIEQEPSINEITELTQLDDLIERMIHKRVYREVEEIMEYLEVAKQQLSAWRKKAQYKDDSKN